MIRLLTALTEPAYAMLRIVAGFLFSCHGMQKLLGMFADPQNPMTDLDLQMKLGGAIELVCGLLIAVGFLTRWAAFLASGTMAVAYIQFHWKGQLGEAFFPIVNKGELAVMYSFLFLFIACRGAGFFSFDRLRARPERH
jgi:putative oxidoreductase